VRALASHQCGPGSNPGVDAICGLSLLLVLSLAPRGFSPGTPVFPSPRKPTFPNSNSTRNQVHSKNHYVVDVLPANRYLFILFFLSPVCGYLHGNYGSLVRARKSTLSRLKARNALSLVRYFSFPSHMRSIDSDHVHYHIYSKKSEELK